MRRRQYSVQVYVTRVATVFVFASRLRAMYGVIDMPWDWPVEVNYLEAKAFCSWKGSNYRLLCEAEFNVIRGNDVSTRDQGERRKYTCVLCCALCCYRPHVSALFPCLHNCLWFL